MHHYQLAIPQLMPNGILLFLRLIVIADEASVELLVDDFLTLYYSQENSKDHGRYSMYLRLKQQVDWPFVIRGALRKLFGTPLFIEPLFDEEALIAELALNTMKIDFPSPKEILARKRVEKEDAKAAAAAKAAKVAQVLTPSPFPLIESFPEPLNVPEQPPFKKKKVGETPRKKALMKKKEQVKAIVPESSNEPQITKDEETDLEVNLPLGTSLLYNKKLGFQILRQLLTDVNMDTVNDGRIYEHLDEFLWDSLKSILRGMGLIYRFTNKVVEQKEQIRELEVVDKEHAEKLLDIERKFKDVRASADGFIAELHTLNQTTKEEVEMIKSMVDRFDKVKAENCALRESIKQKDEDIVGLVTRIVGKYEKATLKAHYELLKEYKQGLLVDADIAEKIELYKESIAKAEALTSAPNTNVEPPTAVIPASTDEINPVAFKPSTTDGPIEDPPKSEKVAKR
ncbi:hypothetical protein TIFTF001_018746 [Ficus carica]|uniref:Uncharacterized protein n=1 Tax=Ficus carica TaxID=3494 RepID=A0AA88AC06_FICCA|nr:hypothetical protein TIFTF001_018746 [Ficus carica]